jgi:hypothetical protein
MNRLEFLKQYGALGVELGCITPDVYMKYVRYSSYTSLLKEGKDKKTAIETCMEEHKLISEVTIYRDIWFFQDAEKGIRK